MPERFRIVGCVAHRADRRAVPASARSAVERVRAHAPAEERWEPFAKLALLRRHRRGSRRLWRMPSARRSVRSAAGRGCCTTCRCRRRRQPASSRSSRATGLNERARVIMEKPFGTDLASARELNETLHKVFDESQIFRIDHFLGKEAVQNILALRFANGMFEPVWNRDHIDHVQIDVPETLSIGTRGEFYEGTGAFRDMVVTHLFQVLGFVAMEPPTVARAEDAGRREDEGVRRDAAAATVGRRARPVRGLPQRAGCGGRLRHRDVRRRASPGGQLALGRGPLLPADGQAPRARAVS